MNKSADLKILCQNYDKTKDKLDSKKHANPHLHNRLVFSPYTYEATPAHNAGAMTQNIEVQKASLVRQAITDRLTHLTHLNSNLVSIIIQDHTLLEK